MSPKVKEIPFEPVNADCESIMRTLRLLLGPLPLLIARIFRGFHIVIPGRCASKLESHSNTKKVLYKKNAREWSCDNVNNKIANNPYMIRLSNDIWRTSILHSPTYTTITWDKVMSTIITGRKFPSLWTVLVIWLMYGQYR